MKELYIIMSDLLELEYNQKSMRYILDALAEDSDERDEAAMLANGIRYYIAGLQAELREVISRLDTYMAERKKAGRESAEKSGT